MVARKQVDPDACEYCGINDKECIVKCTICTRWFCNMRTNTGMSHIAFHLKRSGHNSVTEPGSSNKAKCVKCDTTNVFLLGSHQVVEKCRRSILCRGPCSSGLTPWDPLFDDGALGKWFFPARSSQSKTGNFHRMILTLQELRALEELRLVNPSATIKDLDMSKIKHELPSQKPMGFLNTTIYSMIFDSLLEMDEKESRSKAEKELFDISSIKWGLFDKRNHMCLFSLIDKLRPKDWLPYQRLRIIHGSLSVEGVVKSVSKNCEVSFILDEDPEPLSLETIDFKVMPVWDPTTYKRMKEALRKFEDDPRCASKHVRNIILGEELDYHTSARLEFPDMESFDAPNIPRVNQSQTVAVREALSRPFAIIQGPAGTGKTLTTTTLVYHMAKQEEGEPVLVCAPTNHACDHLTKQISKTGINVVRILSRALEGASSAVEKYCLHKLVEKKASEDLRRQIMERRAGGGNMSDAEYNRFLKRVGSLENQILKAADVICCTCISAGSPTVSRMRFRRVLIDEASLATEPTCLVPMLMGSEQVILVGDHCQLRPTVTSQKASLQGLGESMYERLVRLGLKPYLLDTQFRMHPGISEFPSIEFYSGALRDGVTAGERGMSPFVASLWPSKSVPVVLYHCEAKEEVTSSGTSYLNRVEDKIVVELVSRLVEGGVKGSRIGIVTFYEGQRAQIVSVLNKRSDRLASVEVANVDGFQGREKDYIVLSCVRSNRVSGIGFVADACRLNVALTRARLGLIVCGNALTLGGPKSNDTWRRYLQYLSREKLIVCGSVDKPQPFQLPLIDKDFASYDKENLANKNL